MLATQASSGLRENVATLFGSSLSQQLLPFDRTFPAVPVVCVVYFSGHKKKTNKKNEKNKNKKQKNQKKTPKFSNIDKTLFCLFRMLFFTLTLCWLFLEGEHARCGRHIHAHFNIVWICDAA